MYGLLGMVGVRETTATVMDTLTAFTPCPSPVAQKMAMSHGTQSPVHPLWLPHTAVAPEVKSRL